MESSEAAKGLWKALAKARYMRATYKTLAESKLFLSSAIGSGS